MCQLGLKFIHTKFCSETSVNCHKTSVNCDKTSLNDFVSAPQVAVVSHDCEDCMQLIVGGGGLR